MWVGKQKVALNAYRLLAGKLFLFGEERKTKAERGREKSTKRLPPLSFWVQDGHVFSGESRVVKAQLTGEKRQHGCIAEYYPGRCRLGAAAHIHPGLTTYSPQA